MKRNIVIFSIVIGIVLLFLVGCKKSTSDTIAFVGDEKDMMSCYDIYPQDYFPQDISQDIRDGRFPPDLVGEYEIPCKLVDAYLEFYNSASHRYIPWPDQMYQQIRYMSWYIIIEEQVNGMAKLSFSTKKTGGYNDWLSVDAYIYGDWHYNGNDFLICYEYTDEARDFTYIKGNIIKGTITSEGIKNIDIWSIIKDRTPKEDAPMILNYNGYVHYSDDIAERK